MVPKPPLLNCANDYRSKQEKTGDFLGTAPRLAMLTRNSA
jgi:hypothetical protein